MKRLLGLGVLMLSFSVPAHAQFNAGMVGFGAYGFSGGNTAGVGQSGGGGISGGLCPVAFPVLQHTPMPQFTITALYGTEADFVPTTYVPFAEAFARGQAVMAEKPKSIADVAEEYSTQPRIRAKFIFEQDAVGNAVIWPLQRLQQVASEPSTALRASR